MIRFWLALALHLVFAICIGNIASAYAQGFNTTLDPTSPSIIYSPPICDVNTVCSSAWQISDDIPGIQVVSTSGPDSKTGNIIPQMFIAFRGTAIYIHTSPLTNASANFTLSSLSSSSSSPPQVFTTGLHDSPDFVFTVQGLTSDNLFQLSVTYLTDVDGADGSSGRLDIGSITVTVTNSSASASNLPTPSLPFPNIPPTYFPVLPSSTPRHGQSKAAIIGESVGAAMAGLLPIFMISYYLWRRRRRKRKETFEMSLKWDDEDRGIKRSVEMKRRPLY